MSLGEAPKIKLLGKDKCLGKFSQRNLVFPHFVIMSELWIYMGRGRNADDS